MSDEQYTQQHHTIPAESTYKVEVSFTPDTWYLVPLTALPDPVYISPTVDIDVRSAGIPIQGSNPSTIPAIRRSNILYLYNSAGVDVEFSITASRGVNAPVTSTPTVISQETAEGVYQELTDGANINWDMALGSAEVTLGGNRTMNNPTNVEAGSQYFLLVIQDSTGNRTLDWGTNYYFEGGVTPVLSHVGNMIDLLEFFADDNGYLYLQKVTRNVTNEFSPLDYGSMYCWLDASMITGLSDGDPVATWEDQSGNSNDFSQATPAYKPLWRSTVQNSLPSVQFDGSDDYMLTTVSTFTRPYTLYLVVSMITSATGDRIFSCPSTFGEVYINGTVWRFYNGAGIDGLTVVTGKHYALSAIHTASGGEWWMNGASQGSNSSAGSASASSVYLGRYAGSSSYFSNMYISELIMYEVNHTDTQRESVEEYLNGKYDLW